jgi:hypothetical protein
MPSQKGKYPVAADQGKPAGKVRDSRRPGQKKRADRPKISIRETLVVLQNMERGSGTITDLTQAAHVSRATVYRLLAGCEEELGIRFHCEAGTYSVRDWGVFRRRRVLG